MKAKKMIHLTLTEEEYKSICYILKWALKTDNLIRKIKKEKSCQEN